MCPKKSFCAEAFLSSSGTWKRLLNKVEAREGFSTSFKRARKFTFNHGMSIRTGHCETHREHPVHSSLKRAFSSFPVPASHEPPMPPEYVSPPNACPPTAWKLAQEFKHALQRMQ